MQFDAIIVGQGYAGLKTASLAAAKGLKVAAVEAMFPGGLVMNINELHPAPEGEAPCGPELTGGLAMENMDNVAHNVTDAEVTEITRSGSG
jgi:thioredoxin reductase